MGMQDLALDNVIRWIPRGSVSMYRKLPEAVVGCALKFGSRPVNGEEWLAIENLPFPIFKCENVEMGIRCFISWFKSIQMISVGDGSVMAGVNNPNRVLTSPERIMLYNDVINLTGKN